ncbi:hypothetical protein [Thioclava nitratireducens]|uniref:hypothetical protein n=1 Tax=Thioclava nitratireducens TaxID=1915078 RepID=UPI0024814077|nr:hypothetical protein [Thioclava nitratireducens]WGT50160.1 hypothetical protein P0N61_17940 [Thioclava nitratireducens]
MKALKPRAEALRDRAEAVKAAPILTRMAEGARLADDLAAFVVDLAERIDAVTPFLDEGGGDNTLIGNETDDARETAEAEGEGER